MHRIYLKLTLQDNVVFRGASATAGTPPGLTFIPGGALLGAAASRCYSTLDEKTAFNSFHSGKIRFGRGLPLSKSGRVALPIPLCWSEEKYPSQDEEQKERFINPLSEKKEADKKEADKQNLKAVRVGYITGSGEYIKPEPTATLKTAIDPATGRAKEGQLFGYHGLKAGQVFLASLEADAEISRDLFETITQNLLGNLRLGKSRSAEFGGVYSELVTADKNLVCHGELIGQKLLTLWLLSDMVVLNDLGMPTLIPQPQWLGLPAGKLIQDKTFIRSTTFAPYNSKRKHADMERVAILAGSVLQFQLDEPLDESHQQHLNRGLGLYLETGLGRVWANSPLLANSPVRFDATTPAILALDSAPISQTDDNSAQDPLIKWLLQKVVASERQAEDARFAETLRPVIKSLYQNIRRLNGVPDAVAVGPGSSQWGGVMAMAKKVGQDDLLLESLFGSGKDREGRQDLGLCSEQAGGQGWMEESSLAGNMTTFRQWFEKTCRGTQVQGKRCFVVEMARHAMDIAKEENRQ